MVPAVIGVGRLDVARAGRDDGAIAIMVALLSVVLFGFAALVVDLGNAFDVRAESQNAADAAARAGVTLLAAQAGQVTTNDLADTVKDYVRKNGGPTNWSGCKDPGGLPNTADLDDPADGCITFQATGGTYQVRVQLPDRQVAATLGGIFGVSSIRVAPLAVAQSGDTPSPPCGPCTHALDQDGNPIPSFSDVQMWLPDPDTTPAGSSNAFDCPTSAGAFGTLTITAACTLPSGVYVFDSHDLKIEPGGSLTASNVTLVFYGSGKLEVDAGSKALDLTATPVGAPPTADELPGVALVLAQYPDNPPPVPPQRRVFELGPGFQIRGSVYALDKTVWHTDVGDCPDVVPPDCAVDPGELAVTGTDFVGGIPTVGPRQVLPPQPPHLVK